MIRRKEMALCGRIEFSSEQPEEALEPEEILESEEALEPEEALGKHKQLHQSIRISRKRSASRQILLKNCLAEVWILEALSIWQH